MYLLYLPSWPWFLDAPAPTVSSVSCDLFQVDHEGSAHDVKVGFSAGFWIKRQLFIQRDGSLTDDTCGFLWLGWFNCSMFLREGCVSNCYSDFLFCPLFYYVPNRRLCYWATFLPVAVPHLLQRLSCFQVAMLDCNYILISLYCNYVLIVGLVVRLSIFNNYCGLRSRQACYTNDP